MQENHLVTGPPLPSGSLWKTITEEGQPVHFHQGEYLYSQNEPSPGAYIIESGKVKLFRIMDNGIESILRIVQEGSLIGEVSAFSGKESSPAAIALTPVSAYLISAGRMRDLIRENGEFALFMADSLIYKLKGQTDQMGNISGKKVDSRLAATLCTLDYYGIPRDSENWFSISHAELAGIIGATRPHVTTILSRFRKAEMIEMKKNQIRILSKERLLNRAEAEL